MEFSEMTHAYLAAKYYQYLTQYFGESGELAFIHATQYYGYQRGSRMAQKTIADGKPLTQANYNYYGEWLSSEQAKHENIANKSEVTPDGNLKITMCPWFTQFKNMNATKAGSIYCTYLDQAISNGYNPLLQYKVDQTLHNSSYCLHRLENGNINEGANLGKNPDSYKSFAYHCAHLYWSFNEITLSIFKQKGTIVAQKVMDDFIKDYNQDMADILFSYRNTNFNINE